MRDLILIVLLAFGLPALADGMAGVSALDEARAAHDAGDYEKAAEILEALVERAPDCAECSHQLGRAYGRLAEQSSWVAAVGFAKKTRAAFENAVELDPMNDRALEDLIQYYRTAPGFLGGDDDKADALQRQLDALRTERTG